MKYLDFEEIIDALKAVDDETAANIEDSFNKAAPTRNAKNADEATRSVILGKVIIDAVTEVFFPSKFYCQDCAKDLDISFAASEPEDGAAICLSCNDRLIADDNADERQRNRWQGE